MKKKDRYKERKKRTKEERKERDIVEMFLQRKFIEARKKQAEDLTESETRSWKASAESEFDRIWSGKSDWR